MTRLASNLKVTPLGRLTRPEGYGEKGYGAHGSGITSKSLPMTMQHQQQSNWCWSAVGTSVGLFFKTGKWTQCDTATGCLPGQNCCANPGPCNVYGYLDQSLTYTKSYNTSHSGTSSASEIEAQVNSSKPVCVRVAWNGGGAHFLAITGYSYPDSSPAQVTITLEDSIYGTSTMLLTDFPSQYHGGGTWTTTFLTEAH